MLTTDHDTFQSQNFAPRRGAHERPLRAQLVESAHQRQISLARLHERVIQRGTRQAQQRRLARQAQTVIGIWL